MILIVEDEYELQLVYKDLFQSMSQETAIYNSAEEVLSDMQYLGSQNIQVVISDYYLSGINGLVFLERIKKALKPSLCVLASGNPPAVIPDDVFLFTKPSRFGKLLRAIRAYL